MNEIFCHKYLDGPRSSVLEADAVKPLVEVDGVLPGHHLGHGAGLLSTDHSEHVYRALKQFKLDVIPRSTKG